MLIIGCDYHPGVQQIAVYGYGDGEFGERRIEHGGGEAESSTAICSKRNQRASGDGSNGHALWFERLLEELHFELWIGDPLEIRATRVRKQKTDRHDAQLLLKLLLEERFPRIWVASWKIGFATTSVASASFGADAHTDHESVASHRFKRRGAAKEAAVGPDGTTQLESFALAPWASGGEKNCLSCYTDLTRAFRSQSAVERKRPASGVRRLMHILVWGR